MRRNRRTFLKWITAGAGACVGATGWCLTTSQRRAARWMRRIIEDAQRPVLPASTKPTPSKWSDATVTLCWLGHSTVLLNFYGIHVLTDPALGSRVGVSVGLGTAGPKRYVAPALRVEELPHIDLLLLSHAHRDHLDLPSLPKLY